MASSRARAGERAPARRRRLDRGVVVEEASRLLDQEGLDALTMARLGALLGVTPMALYRHVANKNELVRAATELVLAEFAADAAASGEWSAGVSGWMRKLREHFLAHPWISSFLGTSTEVSTPWLECTDQLAQHLAPLGLPPRLVARELVLISRMTIAIVGLELAAPLPVSGEFADAMLASLEPAERRRRQPIIKAMTKFTDDQLFADFVQGTIRRLEAQAAP